MGKPRTIAGNVVLEYCERYPKKTPDLTLAKIIYRDHPKLFKSLESCRSNVRVLRGHNGEHNRKSTAVKKHYKPVTYDTNPFSLPESHARISEPFKIQQSHSLIISDLHIPYQHNEALTVALKYGKERDINCILINGDGFDFATISRHERDWRDRDVNTEFESARKFFQGLRSAFPNTRIIFKYGNHDERWEKWLYVKAPELFNVSDFQLDILMKFGELGIEVVKEKRIITIGKLNILHGHELQGSGGVNPARATFIKVMDSVLVAHYHRTSSHVESTLSGDIISVNSTGCLCGLNPLWLPINKWNLGMAYVDHDLSSGEYKLDNLKIINGKIY